MKNSPLAFPRFRRAACCAMFASFASAALAVHAGSSPQETIIGVHDGRFVAGGRSYDSLDALRSAVRGARPASVKIVACLPDATASWLATVPGFDDLPMHLDAFDGSSPACAAAMPASARQGLAGARVDTATRRYWDARQP